jgi:hypothetical protein
VIAAYIYSTWLSIFDVTSRQNDSTSADVFLQDREVRQQTDSLSISINLIAGIGAPDGIYGGIHLHKDNEGNESLPSINCLVFRIYYTH